jgi:hypothetical protein
MRKNLRLFSCHHDGRVRRDTSAAERTLRSGGFARETTSQCITLNRSQ